MKLTTQNRRFDAALSNMSQGLSMFDAEQRLIVCNERYAAMYGLPSDALKPGVRFRQFLESRVANGVYPKGTPEAYIQTNLAWVTNKNRCSQVQHLVDGRDIRITHQPMTEGGWVATHEDITDITAAQHTVLRQKEELDAILRNIPRAIVTTDVAGFITTFNPAAEETFGYTAAEAIGQNVTLLMPEAIRTHHAGYIRSYLETGVSKFIEIGPRRLIGLHKHGTEFPMELALGVAGKGENQRFIGVAKDITEDLETENQLIEHRDLLQKEVDLATAELRSQAEKLAESLDHEKHLNEMQRHFVAVASHELRTPLSIIDGSAQRLLRRADRMTPEFFEDRVTKIRSAVKIMTNLMESTLSAARMDTGEFELEIEKCDLRSIVQEDCADQRNLNRDYRIDCDLEDLPDHIAGDATMLGRVFTNLLSNAVKYSPDGPDITVKGWRDGEDAVVSVQDRGLGIAEDDLPNMFSRFFRAGTSKGIAGTGIGLNLVKYLVELHGGSISVESTISEGSTFTVRLPVDGPPAELPTQVEASAA